jgi:predicted nuclease of predicted toxin-antitoxin system
VQSFLLTGAPSLLLIATGNISNNDLETLIRSNLPSIERALVSCRFVELTRDSLIARE